MIDTLAPTTPDLIAALAIPASLRPTRPVRGLSDVEVDEVLYAIALRLDGLGTDPAAQATRERLLRGRAALELELAARHR